LLRAFLGLKKPVVQHYLFIAISFYLNIVCKNVSFDMGINNTVLQTYTLDRSVEDFWIYIVSSYPIVNSKKLESIQINNTLSVVVK